MKTLQVALRAEATSLNMRKPSQRGRMGKLARESTGLSLTAIESGTGVMVWEPDTISLIDLPSQVFENFIAESNSDNGVRNIGIQKALLSLEGLFQANSPVEWIQFIDGKQNVGTVNVATIERIRRALTEPALSSSEVAHQRITGRLLELNLVNRTFEVHSAHDKTMVCYDDFLEPLVIDALKRFVVADIQKDPNKGQTLLAVTTLDDIPESRFDDVRNIQEIIGDQGLEPILDFAALAMTELDETDTTTLEEFNAFIRSARHDEVC